MQPAPACTRCDPADDIVTQSIVTKARSSLEKLHLSADVQSALPEDEALQSTNSFDQSQIALSTCLGTTAPTTLMCR